MDLWGDCTQCGSQFHQPHAQPDFYFYASGLEVDLGGSALNVISQFTNPLLNLTRDLELETATISKAQFVVPWINRKFSDDELVEAMVQASSVWRPLAACSDPVRPRM